MGRGVEPAVVARPHWKSKMAAHRWWKQLCIAPVTAVLT